MGRSKKIDNTNQPELPMEVYIPSVQVRQPDGSLLIKAGKPQVISQTVSTTEAARLLGLSQRTIEHQYESGDFKTAEKPGGKSRSRWRIARSEVMSRKGWRPE